MTYTIEKITEFVDFQIKDINHHIEFAKTIVDFDRERKIEWAKQAIHRSREQTFGTLLYLRCWSKEINEEQFDELNNKINEIYHDAYYTRVWDEIK